MSVITLCMLMYTTYVQCTDLNAVWVVVVVVVGRY